MNRHKWLFSLALVALLSGGVSAQETSFSAEGGTIPEGGNGVLSLSMDNTGNVIAGWSFGICNDTSLLTVNDASSGADTDTSKNGAAPDFNQIGVFAEGATQGVVICFTGCATVEDVSGFELLAVDYQGVAEGSTSIDFCNTLGSPPVETVIVVNGASSAPTQNSGAVDVVGVPDPEYTYSVASQTVSYNGDSGVGNFSASASIVEVDNSALGAPFPNDTQGFSMGLANDPALLAPSAISITLPFSADFAESSVFADGVTAGVVYSFTGGQVLAFDTTVDVISVDYDTVPGGLAGNADATTTTLAFEDTLGSPPVANVAVVNGASLVPNFESGSITLEPLFVPDPEFTFSAGNESANYNPGDGNASVTVGITVSETDNSAAGAVFPNITQGFSMGLGNGPEVGATALNLSLGFDADFAESNLSAEGWTLGVVYSFTGGQTLTFGSPSEIISVDYATGGSMAGDETGTTVALNWTDDLGSPAVVNLMVVDGGSFAANKEDGSISLNPVITVDFIRGDSNSDGIVNIADAVWIIYELFLNGPATTCPIASDSNNDGFGDLADATFIIMYRFMEGAAPAAPFPDCGQVDGQTPEDCGDSSCL